MLHANKQVKSASQTKDWIKANMPENCAGRVERKYLLARATTVAAPGGASHTKQLLTNMAIIFATQMCRWRNGPLQRAVSLDAAMVARHAMVGDPNLDRHHCHWVALVGGRPALNKRRTLSLSEIPRLGCGCRSCETAGSLRLLARDCARNGMLCLLTHIQQPRIHTTLGFSLCRRPRRKKNVRQRPDCGLHCRSTFANKP